MDDASHAANGSRLEVAGYGSCRNEHCANLVLDIVAERTDRLCVECFRGDLNATLAQVEIVNRGRALTVRYARPKKRSKVKGNRATYVAGKRARNAADDRMRRLFPDLFAVIHAEERARYGLEPFPVDNTIEAPAGDLSASIDFALVYAALTEHGVDVDAPQSQPATAD